MVSEDYRIWDQRWRNERKSYSVSSGRDMIADFPIAELLRF